MLACGRWGDEEICAMPRADWRSTAPYDDKRKLDASGFAFEFLRRNAEFVKDHERLVRLAGRNVLSRKSRESFARRWGLRFREVRPRRQAANDPLDGDGPANCYPTCPGTTRP
jgi:hypothetical protein